MLLHNKRNDTNLVETPWMASKDELPKEQYTWAAPAPQGGDSKPIVASHRYKKVCGACVCLPACWEPIRMCPTPPGQPAWLG